MPAWSYETVVVVSNSESFFKKNCADNLHLSLNNSKLIRE